MDAIEHVKKMKEEPIHLPAPPGGAMTFDLTTILESKRALRSRLASLPIVEKLHTLDALRERETRILASANANARSTCTNLVPPSESERTK